MIDILGNKKIPKYIIRNNHRYKFIKKYNTNLYLYEDIKNKFKECFIGQDLFITPDNNK